MPVPRRLTTEQISSTAETLLRVRPLTGQRELRDELEAQFGVGGKNARITRILKEVRARLYPSSGLQPLPPDGNTSELRARLHHAESRAAAAERERDELRARERTRDIDSQDFWAKRYQEKVDELQRRYDAVLALPPGVTHEDYLRQRDRIAALEARLALTEEVYEK